MVCCTELRRWVGCRACSGEHLTCAANRPVSNLPQPVPVPQHHAPQTPCTEWLLVPPHPAPPTLTKPPPPSNTTATVFNPAPNHQLLLPIPPQIGGLLICGGVSLLIFNLLLFARLSRRISVTSIWRGGALLCAVFYPWPPVLAAFAHSHDGSSCGDLAEAGSGGQAGADLRWPLVLLLSLHTVLLRFAHAATFTSTFLVINNSVPAASRGRANGLAMGFAAAFRAAGPSAGGAMFAWSLTNGIVEWPLDVHFGFLVTSGIAAITAAFGLVALGTRYDQPPEVARELPPDEATTEAATV